MIKQRTTVQQTATSRPYIEPSIRVIAGFLLTVIGIAIYYDNSITSLLLVALLFISLNLFQSGFTGFCLMEKILKHFGFRSELSEIKALSDEAKHAADIQKNYMKTLSLLNEAVLELSANGGIITASEGWYKLLDAHVPRNMTPGTSLSDYAISDDADLFEKMLLHVVKSEEVYEIRFRLKRKDEKEQWVLGKFMHEIVSRGADTRIRGVLRDITEAHLQEKQIKHIALHDPLTGLPNRILLEERMDLAIALARRERSKLGLLFIDLDNFKQVNDEQGHKAGDQLLISVSGIMKQRIRESDTLARWGGDEFVVVIPGIDNESQINGVARVLMDDLHQGLVTSGHDAIVTLSIGGAVYPDNAATKEDLLAFADKALYYAKAQGKNTVKLYSELSHVSL